MRKCLLFALLLLGVVGTQAQPLSLGAIYDPDLTKLNADSLRGLLLQAKTDSDRVDLLILLGQSYLQRNKDSALRFTQQAISLAQRINYPRGLFGARTRMALVFRDEGNYPKAIELLLTNLNIAERYHDTLRLYFMNQFLSFVYGAMTDFMHQLQYARRVQQLVHSGFFKTTNDVQYYALRGYVNPMARAFEGLNQLDSALFYWQRSYNLAATLKDNQRIAFANLGLASILAKQDRVEEAFTRYRTALDYAGKTGRGFSESASREEMMAQSWLGMAMLFAKSEQWDSATYYGHMSLARYQSLTLPAQELKADLFLNELYAKQNRTDSAYKYLQMAMLLKDSLFNQEKTRQVQNLQFNETLRMQQLEQERKEALQRYQVNLKLYALAAGLVLVLLIAFFLYRNNKAKQMSNVLLLEQKRMVEEAYARLQATQAQLVQQEKMASLGELTAGIAHEIQNPLNFVNNFSEANKELLDELQQANENGEQAAVTDLITDIKANEEKIYQHGKRADSIVKNMLQHARTSTGKKEPVDINALADEYLRLAYHGFRARDKNFNVVLETQFDESIGQLNVVPQEIGRVFLNLYNNAFYAVMQKKARLNGNYEPTVSVHTKQYDKIIEITVNDNGLGIPQKLIGKIIQPFFTTKPTGEGTGLGLSLSYDIIKAHGGELKVQSKEGEGSEFIIRIPVV
jgi:signal transduction histidine kinase